MAKIASILFSLLLVHSALSLTMFNQVELTTKNGAMCLDGSPYAIYVYVPDPEDFDVIANKLLVFWEEVDFGWCFKTNTSASIEECHKWMVEDNLIDSASSTNWPDSEFFLNGILSWFEGGYFNNWPKVIIKSCDGGSFLGNAAPITFKGKKIHFRGTQNVLEAVTYLNKINFLKNREEVVMVGSFNAGIGALLWSDYFRAQTNGKFRLIADATLFLNEFNYKHNATVIQDRMEQVQKFALENATLPNTACAAAHRGEEWRCLFVDELINFVKYPVYFMQSLYDGWDISEVLGFYCTEEWGSLSECTKEERDIIDSYHGKVTDSLNRIIGLNENHSAFAIACVAHQFMGGKWNNEWYEVPEASGHRPMTVTSNWAMGKSRELYIDKVEWPLNKICSRKAASVRDRYLPSKKQPLLRSH